MSDNEVYEIEKQTKADFIKCQACGSNMVFDPESQMLFCEHCETKVSIESSKQVSEIAIETAFSQTEVWSDTAVLTCSNCGASIAVSREEVALCCPYCGVPLRGLGLLDAFCRICSRMGWAASSSVPWI